MGCPSNIVFDANIAKVDSRPSSEPNSATWDVVRDLSRGGKDDHPPAPVYSVVHILGTAKVR